MVRKNAVALAIVHGLAANEADIEKRIVGGDYASLKDNPCIVSLQTFQGKHLCGGGLLDNKTVVTAAHCSATGNFTSVRAGSLAWNSSGVTSEILWRQEHQEYKRVNSEGVGLVNDIAIFKLKDPIQESGTIKYCKLPDKSLDPAPNTTAFSAGWGSSSDLSTDQTSDKLRKITAPIISREDCKKVEKYDKAVGNRDTVVCLGAEGNKGPCGGDSGGPVIDQETKQLIGLVSFAVSLPDKKSDPSKQIVCGRKPTVLTRVSSYLDYIRDHLEPFQPPQEEVEKQGKELAVKISKWRQETNSTAKAKASN